MFPALQNLVVFGGGGGCAAIAAALGAVPPLSSVS